MRTLPIPPRPGEKVSATLIREIIRAIGERTPIAGHGVKVSIGPNGSVISSEAKSVTTYSVRSDNTCFRFGTISSQENDGNGGTRTVEHPAIVCCYYNVGGVTKHMDDFDVNDILPDEGTEEDHVTLICFKLTGGEPSIVSIDEDDLSEQQADMLNYVRPLYRYVGESLNDDLRNAPQIQEVEVIG